MQIVDGKSRQTLLNEAAMQTRMIRNLERWLKLLTAFSGLGILLAWCGANNAPPGAELAAEVLGTFLAVLAMLAIFVVNKGIGNGRSNVGKILALLDKG